MKTTLWFRLRHLPGVVWAYLNDSSVMFNCTFAPGVEMDGIDLQSSPVAFARILGNTWRGAVE